MAQEFTDVDLSGSRFRDVLLHDVVMIGVELAHVRIDGAIKDVVINGVDVVPYVEAELDRRDPERPKMRPTDPAGFREAWDIVERRWAETVARARVLPAALLDESVEGEWSFIQTLRHLTFATDSWVTRAILGQPTPWHRLGLPWEGAPDIPGWHGEREARPSLDEVLEVRRDRMATVRAYLDDLTEQVLESRTEPVDAPGWPPPESFPVRRCLLIVLNEEYLHRLFAERDLAVLEQRVS
ncbi:DinB family protein [Nocardioides sp. MAH-18]|uniref:DinB family protein n=1 Tax=Nocardioides agri TaxID=2682843 RepID=A0A6L6XYA3_9ACTN|nr:MULTISPECIES: DinB family protein [unclassified Nocardioides]MBA2952610.1 DinB family protein [Nocardioides sp. CGMCC 1.13656]MVQ51772.1 DinB family protein [Nocardioides sp. MAH-18]